MTITTLEDDGKLMKPKAAADYLGISETSLRRLYNAGLIPRISVTENRHAFRLGDLRAYIESRPLTHGGALG